MRDTRVLAGIGSFIVWLACAGVGQVEPSALAGRWQATVVANGVDVPCRFDIEVSGSELRGTFFNGDEKVTSRAGSFERGTLTLAFPQYGAMLTARFADGQLQGQYDRGKRGVYPFRAVRATTVRPSRREAPSIAGVWTIPVKSSKGESAWRFIVRQEGADISAGILRVDGDTGVLTGSYDEGTFVLSHFSGARPLRLEVTLAADGSLDLLENGRTRRTAVRADDVRARDAGEPTDPSAHTRVKDASVPFRFSFPDLNGQLVSEKDFAGKVVLVNITGSWCPNCHDEAPFLAGLYRKYRDRGLEIVGLSFEEAEELENPKRLRAFINEYGLEYTFLLAGEPEQVSERIPQAENLNSFPTTFLLGRDGRVRAVHAGFPSAASGDFLDQARQAIEAQVQRLIAEPKGSE